MKNISGIILILLISLLAACQGGSTTPALEPSFTLSPLDNSIDIVENGSSEINFQVTKHDGFDDTISINLSPQAGFSATPLTIASGSEVGSLELSTTAPAGNYSLVFVGTSGDQVENITLNVTVVGTPANIDAVSIEGNDGSAEVRQGAGELTLLVTGEGLADLSSPALDGLDIELDTVSDTEARLVFTVPHGAESGDYDLSVNLGGESLEFNNVVVVTHIHASETGDDAAGKGTPSAPFRSLSKALSVAEQGDTVDLDSGTYSQAGGETWAIWEPGNQLPGLIDFDVAQNVPAGVTLVGQGATTILQGEEIGSYTLGLVLEGDAEISNLLLRNFEYAILVDNGTVKLENIITEDSAAGLWAYGNSKIAVMGDSAFAGSVMGVGALNSTQLNLVGTQLTASGFGIGINQNAEVLLKDVQATGNFAGIAVLGSKNLRLENVDASNNAVGMDISGGTIRVRDSKFNNNSSFGIRVLEEVDKLDLGTGNDAGNNVLSGNATVQFLDARPERPAPGGTTIDMSATTINDAVPASAVLVGPYGDGEKGITIAFKNNLVQINDVP